MTLIVAAKRGDEIACIADMLATSNRPEPAKRLPTTGPASLTAVTAPPPYFGMMIGKVRQIAPQAYVMLAGDMSQIEAFVADVRQRCGVGPHNQESLEKACEGAAAGRPDFTYIAVSQLDVGPKIYAPPNAHFFDRLGVRYVVAGSGEADFRRYFGREFEVQSSESASLRDFFFQFAGCLLCLQNLAGKGLAEKYGGAFEYLNNGSGRLSREDKILVDVVNMRRGDKEPFEFYYRNVVGADGKPQHVRAGIRTFQAYVGTNNLLVFELPVGAPAHVHDVSLGPPGGSSLPPKAETTFCVETVVSLLQASPSSTAVAAEVLAMSDYGHPMKVILGPGDTPAAHHIAYRLATVKAVWEPRYERAAAYLGI